MKWWSQPPVFASVRSNAVLSHRCLLPGHQPVRWRLSLLPSSSRTPGLLARRANGARDSIRLCAAMETTSSTHSKNRRSGSTQHSGMCLRVGDLPEQGADAVTRFILITMVSRVYYLRSQAWLTRKEAGGDLHAGGLGLGPDMGAGQRFPSAGIARHPPRKNGAGGALALTPRMSRECWRAVVGV